MSMDTLSTAHHRLKLVHIALYYTDKHALNRP